MSKLKLAHQVRDFIAQNKTKEALHILQEHLVYHSSLEVVLSRAAQQQGLNKKLLLGQVANGQAGITQSQIHAALLQVVEDLIQEELSATKVFISYNRDQASSKLAKYIRTALKKDDFQVFMDVEDLPIGADWAKTILYEIETCHYFIVLVSELANSSEMVIKELEKAYAIKSRQNLPLILPIRVGFPIQENRLNTRLNSMLSRIQQLEWNTIQDSEHILFKLKDVLYGRKQLNPPIPEEIATVFSHKTDRPPTPVADLEVPRGSVHPDSKYYIERSQEASFIEYVEQPAAVLRIRGPRQFGKTSLLTRVMTYAVARDYHIIFIDFQELDDNLMSNLEGLLWEFGLYFAEEFGLEEEFSKQWERPRSKKQICTAFIEKQLLRKLDKPILLALDEADRLFKHQKVSAEFFLLLRSWHEKSKVPNKEEWEQFRLALSYSTEAKLAIQDLNASPFNIGEEAKLYPFNQEQVAELAYRHGLVWTPKQLEEIVSLLGGQPYLIRRSMYLIAKQEYIFERLIAKAAKDDGPFGDHLRHHLVNLKQHQDLIISMQQILGGSKCRNVIHAARLAAAGLTKGTAPDIIVANKLYASYFNNKF